MKPTKIAFTKKYFPEQYHGEDYFIEYILEEGDTLCDAFKKAKEETLQCFKNNNPQIQWHDEVVKTNKNYVDMHDVLPLSSKHMDENIAKLMKENPPHTNKTPTIEEQAEQVKKEIEVFCKSPALFKAIYANQVKGNRELELMYEQKLHKLESKTSNSINQ